MYMVHAQIGKHTLPNSVRATLLGISELGSLKVVSGILMLVEVTLSSDYV